MTQLKETIARLRDKRDRAINYKAISLDITVKDIKNVLEYVDTLEVNSLRAADRGDAQRYVLGLLFKNNFSNVVLIQKTKPRWQAGLLNGVGGKIEPGEGPVTAMVREFKEETGADTSHLHWLPFCEMSGNMFVVECFTAIDDQAYDIAATVEEEHVVKVSPDELSRCQCVPHLKWLVRLAMDIHTGERFFSTVRYSEPFRFL